MCVCVCVCLCASVCVCVCVGSHTGGGCEKFENGVQPCGWGARPDIPNPPGLSREVFAVDGRAGLDIPNPPGPSREVFAVDRNRIKIDIGSKSDRNRIGNWIEIGSKSPWGVT